ncbi:MAG TPA: ImcF-related family protein, partial [Minicystis sp.]|nr:ImcF-related family protein [Minicystis sp.]
EARHLAEDAGWEAAAFSRTCAEAVAVRRGLSLRDAHAEVDPHVAALVWFVQTGVARGPAIDRALVARVRRTLAREDPAAAGDLLGMALGAEAASEPVTMASLLAGASDVAPWVRSKQWSTSGRPRAVPGLYTSSSRRAVHARADEAMAALARDGWVVGDAAADERLDAAIRRALHEYDARRAAAWLSLLADVDAVAPATVEEARGRLRAASAGRSPFDAWVRAVDGDGEGGAEAPLHAVLAFSAAPTLDRYRAILARLAGDLEHASPAGARRLFAGAARDVRALLRPFDEAARDALAPALLAPLAPPA